MRNYGHLLSTLCIQNDISHCHLPDRSSCHLRPSALLSFCSHSLPAPPPPSSAGGLTNIPIPPHPRSRPRSRPGTRPRPQIVDVILDVSLAAASESGSVPIKWRDTTAERFSGVIAAVTPGLARRYERWMMTRDEPDNSGAPLRRTHIAQSGAASRLSRSIRETTQSSFTHVRTARLRLL